MFDISTANEVLNTPIQELLLKPEKEELLDMLVKESVKNGDIDTISKLINMQIYQSMISDAVTENFRKVKASDFLHA